MDIFSWLGLIFTWGVALAFSLIPGWLAGNFAEYFAGSWAYWPGFIVGAAIFLYHMRDWLAIFFPGHAGVEEVKPVADKEERERPTAK